MTKRPRVFLVIVVSDMHLRKNINGFLSKLHLLPSPLQWSCRLLSHLRFLSPHRPLGRRAATLSVSESERETIKNKQKKRRKPGETAGKGFPLAGLLRCISQDGIFWLQLLARRTTSQRDIFAMFCSLTLEKQQQQNKRATQRNLLY